MKGDMGFGFAIRLVVFLAFVVFMGMANAYLLVDNTIRLIMFVALFMMAVWVYLGYDSSK